MADRSQRTRGSRRASRLRGGAAEAVGGSAALRAAALAAAFLGAALLLYAPAYDGPFLSDDQHYVEHNPYVHELGGEELAAILDPRGAAARQVENYAPVHLLLHGLAWQAFGRSVAGHHVVNVGAHALAALLLVPLLRRLGLGAAAALFAGAFFLLHPANVEAVAWISQLKSTSALALALGALLCHPRRPAVGSALFALALLAKPIAAFALPVAAVRAWVRGGAEGADPDLALRERRAAPWLGLWAVALAAFAAVEIPIFESHSGNVVPTYPDPAVRAWTALWIALRYLGMAATSLGTSAFHEPAPVASLLHPKAALALLVLLGLAARAGWTLWHRRPEAVGWVWAGAAYAPVSQIFPFPFPMADRYLYFVLPGLLLAGLLAGGDALRAASRRLEAAGVDPARLRVPARRAAALLAALWLAAFAAHASQRAELWSSRTGLMAEAARSYPHGSSAGILRARAAARRGDVEAALSALRPLVRRGYNRFDVLLKDRAYDPVREDPRFRALLREMAGWWIARIGERETLGQPDLHMLALAHALRGEREAAARALRRGLARGGPYDARLREELRALESGEPVELLPGGGG